MKRMSRVCILLCILVGTGTGLHSEAVWPQLTPELWQDMTPAELHVLLSHGNDISQRDGVGMTPLMRAARSNPNPEIHAMLIAAGSDVNARNMAEYTALIWATRENPNPEVVLLLLDAGANTALRGVDGRRAVEFLPQNPALLGSAAAARLRGR